VYIGTTEKGDREEKFAKGQTIKAGTFRCSHCSVNPVIIKHHKSPQTANFGSSSYKAHHPMTAQEFLDYLARHCDAAFTTLLAGIGEYYRINGTMTAKQGLAVRTSAVKLGMSLPNDLVILPANGAPPDAQELPVLSTMLREIAGSLLRAAERLT
jgi:hypothetical protein